MKTYILKPLTTFSIVNTNPALGKLNDPMFDATVSVTPAPTEPVILRTAPLPPATVALPPRQPLPTPVIDPTKAKLKLGLDVHLEFIMAVAQRDHASPLAPRKFTPGELVEQVRT